MGTASQDIRYKVGMSEADFYALQERRKLGVKKGKNRFILDPDKCNHLRPIDIKKGKMRAIKCLDCDSLLNDMKWEKLLRIIKRRAA